MNAILGVYTDLDEVTNLQCDYLETLKKCEHLEKELSKSRTMSKSFEALQKHAINLELDLQQCKEKIKNDKSFKENQSNVFLKEREQYVEIQDLKAQLQDKGIAISLRVKVIRCDNGTEFKNRVMNQFCEIKGIKRKPALSFMRPFGCPITILNTIDHLGKIDGKADEGFFVGYSTNSKAFRVFNSRTRIVEKNLHVQFSENTSNIAGSTKACDDAGKTRMETVPGKDYILLPMWPAGPLFSQNIKESPDAGFKPSGEEEKIDTEDLRNENEALGKDSEVLSIEKLREDQRVNQELDASINNTNNINSASDGNSTNNVNAVSLTVNVAVT
ncbi:putative ribonuclease H-like domain-containing protein [Tanacetum coccineum]